MKVSCLCLLSGLLVSSRGQRIRSRLLWPVSVEDLSLGGITGLNAAERTTDFSAELWKSEMTHSQGCPSLFFCFYIQWLIVADSIIKKKRKEKKRAGPLVLLWWIQRCKGGSHTITMTGFHSETYCHVLEEKWKWKGWIFFQSCLFILEIEPVKRAGELCYKLAVIKGTQQWSQVKFTRLSEKTKLIS